MARPLFGRRDDDRERDLDTGRRRDPEFRETLAQPIPNRTYRSQVELIDSRTSPAEQLIRYVAVILSSLLVVRFVVNLFTTNTSNWFVSLVYSLTNWMVAPFQAVFGQPASGSGGYFDWPAIAALIVVMVLATLLISLIRPRD